MGLDAYIKVEKTEPVVTELWYGRKENAIHGWMQRQSGIPAEDFNCVKLPLTKELLKEFKKDLKVGKVSTTSGFFFGESQDPKEITEAAKDFLEAAQTAIKAGDEPYYFSWW